MAPGRRTHPRPRGPGREGAGRARRSERCSRGARSRTDLALPATAAPDSAARTTPYKGPVTRGRAANPRRPRPAAPAPAPPRRRVRPPAPRAPRASGLHPRRAEAGSGCRPRVQPCTPGGSRPDAELRGGAERGAPGSPRRRARSPVDATTRERLRPNGGGLGPCPHVAFLTPLLPAASSSASFPSPRTTGLPSVSAPGLLPSLRCLQHLHGPRLSPPSLGVSGRTALPWVPSALNRKLGLFVNTH